MPRRKKDPSKKSVKISLTITPEVRRYVDVIVEHENISELFAKMITEKARSEEYKDLCFSETE